MTVRLLLAGAAAAVGALVGANVAVWIAWRVLDAEDGAA